MSSQYSLFIRRYSLLYVVFFLYLDFILMCLVASSYYCCRMYLCNPLVTGQCFIVSGHFMNYEHIHLITLISNVLQIRQHKT